MFAHDLRGIWTYRSFANSPLEVEDFSKLKVWEAELYLEVGEDARTLYGHLGERPDVASGSDPFLIIQGNFSAGDPCIVRWRATGSPQTQFDGWIYDYEGVLSPFWRDGVNQKPTIIGTVVRTVRHGEAPAGSVFSFIAVKRDFREAREVIPLKDAVIEMLASAEHRFHHALWHASRDEWRRLSDQKKDRLRKLDWQPGPKDAERNSFGAGMFVNGSGEDFLFMHRRMLAAVRAIDPVDSWPRIPREEVLASFTAQFQRTQVGNSDGYAVPAPWVVPGDPGMTNWLHQLKQTSTLLGRFQAWESQFTDPTYLARVTLGELGSRLEWTIHNWMHMRWASVPRDPRTGRAKPEGRSTLDFDEKWLSPAYDYLGETFSSHVHPVFWRLHGWVDDRIEDWFKAQEATRPGRVKRRTHLGVLWFETSEWVSVEDPWEGPLNGHGGHGGHGEHGHGSVALDVAKMKEALSVIFGPDDGAPPARSIREGLISEGPERGMWFKNALDEMAGL